MGSRDRFGQGAVFGLQAFGSELLISLQVWHHRSEPQPGHCARCGVHWHPGNEGERGLGWNRHSSGLTMWASVAGTM